MSLEKLEGLIASELDNMSARGTLKGRERAITGVKPAAEGFGPRFYLAGQGKKKFIRMNSNSYLGLSLNSEVIRAAEEAACRYGTGPGAVRFIAGTYEPHVKLEEALARFHGRDAAMIFSAAYSAVMGVVPQLITEETLVISDDLNHNCIINAIKLSRPGEKDIYRHLDMGGLEGILKNKRGKFSRCLLITDGIFSMRGDHAPLEEIARICQRYESDFEEGIITVADDSHGVGAFGVNGRGTEEYTGTKVDILIGTLGKAFGVNGGYLVTSDTLVRYLREKSPFYVYSNPITPAEAAAALKSLEIVDSPAGLKLLEHLGHMTSYFEKGLIEAGYETIPGEHPIVPLMIRDTGKTSRMVDYLFDSGILATSLNSPVVPKGDEEIRFQISASHTKKDLEYVLDVIKKFPG